MLQSFKKVEELLESVKSYDRVLLHPSSCQYFPGVEDAPFDVVILCSMAFRTSFRRGKAYCLRADNNVILGILTRRRIKVHCFSVIRDGCMEGGNYECVLGTSFIGRLMPILSDEFELHRDHGYRKPDLPISLRRCHIPRYHSLFVAHSAPVGNVSSLLASKMPAYEASYVLGKTKIRILRDSIWGQLPESDLVIHAAKESAIRGIQNYLSGLTVAGIEDPRIWLEKARPMVSIRPILMHAQEHKLKKLAISPSADGNYEQMIAEIRSWEGEFPSQITFCHLAKDDFIELRSLACKTDESSSN